MMTTEILTSAHPQIDVTLSRPTVRVGGTVVGTIRVKVVHSTVPGVPLFIPPRDILESIQLAAVGLCRLDPRWHRSTSHSTTTQRDDASTHPPVASPASLDQGIPSDFVFPSHTVPFWTAGSIIELMHIPERTYGKWEDVYPTRPIPLPYDDTPHPNIWVHPNEDKKLNDQEQLLFTFRINLPKSNDHFPHSFNGTSCRYYFLIVIRVETITATEPEWILRPVTVLSAHPDQGLENSSLHGAAPPLQVMAHSTGLPTQISASELQQWEGQYTVNQYGGSETLYRNVRRAQSMCIRDPSSHCNVAILTIFGSPANLHPGCRLSFEFAFPIRDEDGKPQSWSEGHDTTIEKKDDAAFTDWIPCYQVSACLQGQEVAIYSNGTSVTQRKLTRRYVWNTAHKVVDPYTTECISLNLVVPESIPCTIQTDHVELSVQCLLDITIATMPNPKTKLEYRNVHLEIPCQVRHALLDWERGDADEDMTPSESGQRNTLPELYESVQVLEQQRYLSSHNHLDGTEAVHAPPLGPEAHFPTETFRRI